MCPVCEHNISSSFPCLPFQQTSDNKDSLKSLKRRVQSLFGVLASPVSEGDYEEKGRRVELERFVLCCVGAHQPTYPSPRKLKGVIAKLEPLTEQHVLIKFLRNVDNAQTLTGFVQELADAITDYQV